MLEYWYFHRVLWSGFYNLPFLDALVKQLWKATASFVISVCLSVCACIEQLDPPLARFS